MSSAVTITELLKMQPDDLHREIRAQHTLVEKMRIGIQMSKEKDTAKYRREKRQLARMHTAQSFQKKGLNAQPKATRVAAPVPAKSDGGQVRKVSKAAKASKLSKAAS